MILLPLQDVIRAIPITLGNALGLLLLPLRGVCGQIKYNYQKFGALCKFHYLCTVRAEDVPAEVKRTNYS